MKEKIEFYRMRTFTDMLSDTFLFVRQNFKRLFKGLFFICSPALLLSMIAGFFFWDGYTSLLIWEMENPQTIGDPVSMIAGMIFLYLCVFIASTLIMDVTYSYIKLYRENKEREITVSMLWQECKKYFWKLLGAQFVVGLIILAIIILFIFLTMFVSNGNDMLMFFLIFIMLIIFGIAGIFLFVRFVFFPFFIVVGDSSLMDSFSGSYNFTRGIYWKTLGFLFVIGVTVSFASGIFLIPGYVMMFVTLITGMAHGPADISFLALLGNALLSIGMACGYIFYSLLFVGQSILYFSEIEKEQGVVANREIDEIGKHYD